MTVRRRTAIVSTVGATVAVALAAFGAFEIAGQSERAASPTGSQLAASEPPRGVVADCSTQSGARFPGAFTSSRNLVVGPLVLVGAGGMAAFARGFGGNKFPLLVRAGHRVTLELSRRSRLGAGLAYGRLPQGRVRLRDAHRVVRFIACRRGERSASSADGRPVTFWSGGVLAVSPRCVPLHVWVDSESSPRRAILRLGVRRCP
jgi:hypothetical protein